MVQTRNQRAMSVCPTPLRSILTKYRKPDKRTARKVRFALKSPRYPNLGVEEQPAVITAAPITEEENFLNEFEASLKEVGILLDKAEAEIKGDPEFDRVLDFFFEYFEKEERERKEKEEKAAREREEEERKAMAWADFDSKLIRLGIWKGAWRVERIVGQVASAIFPK